MHRFFSSAVFSGWTRHLTHQNVNVHLTHVQQHIWTHAAPVTFVCLTFALSPLFLSCSVRPTSAVFPGNNEFIPLFFGLRHDSSWFHMEPWKLWQPLIKLSIYQPSGYESPWTNQVETLEGGRRPGLTLWCGTAGTLKHEEEDDNCGLLSTSHNKTMLIWAKPFCPRLLLFLSFLLSVSSLLSDFFSLHFDPPPLSRESLSLSLSSSSSSSFSASYSSFSICSYHFSSSSSSSVPTSSLSVTLLPLSGSKTSAASSAKQMDVLSSCASRHQPLLSAPILLLRRR